MGKKVIVIGAGVAGLASAIRLQNKGFEVEIIEKQETVGGKMNQISGKGFTFDVGPTIVMMPDVYREIFEVAGRDADDYIPMEKLDPMYTLAFSEDDIVSVSTDLVDLTKFLEQTNHQAAAGFMAYLADIYKRYLIAKEHFIERPFRGPGDFYTPNMLYQAMRLKTFNSAHNSIAKFVRDERIQKMLSFQTLYIGISPYNGPSIYTIIPMIEMIYGVWFIKGGMYAMAQGMERLFHELGGKISYNTAVTEIIIEDGQARGIKTATEAIFSDYVICNADFPYAVKNLVKDQKSKGKYTDKKIESMKYSCSCFLLYLGISRKLEMLDVHNIVFAKNFDENINDIFGGVLPKDPSIYLYVASKMDQSLAPEGKEALYVLVPVSDVITADYQWTQECQKQYRDEIIKIIEKRTGVSDFESLIEFEHINTPNSFEEQYNAHHGATFGLAPTLLQSNYYRPHNKSSSCENLYYTGSSIHPGAGVPIVLTSGKLTAGELIKDEKEK
ncbi:MAG: phytoene desaturase family protein [Culicoidibacterales bacterium]